MKVCNICKIDKLEEEFHKNKSRKNGLEYFCKNCASIKKQTFYQNNQKRYSEYYQNNKEKILSRIKEYYQNNKEKINETKNKYAKNRRKNNINYKIACSLRTRLRMALKGKQKSGSAISDLGCSIEFFKNYIESLWKPGMDWNNHGLYGWHLDHKIPLSKFNLENRKEFLEACHYTNIQPLWAKENLNKSDKSEHNQIS